MTSTGKHHKHPPLARPAIGEWGRNELAIIGAPCPVIRAIAETIIDRLGTRHKVCYVDAEHTAEADRAAVPFKGDLVFTDRIHSRRVDMRDDLNTFQRRALLSQQDVVLVNGNHFTAQQQIVLLHSKKTESLQRKTDRLTDVVAVLEMDVQRKAAGFVEPYLKDSTRFFHREQEAALAEWLEHKIGERTPAVRGLVLAGGRSQRMGADKTVFDFHGLPQREHLATLLGNVLPRVSISMRPGQDTAEETHHDVIRDRFVDLGPFGAILSAMMSDPDRAWLVLAADLPFIAEQALRDLLDARDPSKVATAFHNPATGFPEPLITLWEPKAYPVMLQFLAQGNSCPRKVLINSDVHVIDAGDPAWLLNVNTPEDLENVRRMMTTAK